MATNRANEVDSNDPDSMQLVSYAEAARMVGISRCSIRRYAMQSEIEGLISIVRLPSGLPRLRKADVLVLFGFVEKSE